MVKIGVRRFFPIPGVFVMIRLFLIVFILAGCAPLQQTEAPDTLPQLLYQVPLPAWQRSTVVQDFPLELLIRVTAEGTVGSARLLTSSGSREWDTLALAAVRQWRFAPARDGARPIPTWIRQKVRVHFEAPAMMMLREIACANQRLADSLYALLLSGVPFDSLAREYSASASREQGGLLGEVDIRAFPTHIRRPLGNLHIGEISKPLLLGENFVIYKRIGIVK